MKSATCVVGDCESTFECPEETFFLGYRGSIAHGMFVPRNDPKCIDDIDLMGFVFGEPRDYIGLHEWGSRGTKEIKRGQYDVVLYEVRKAFSLLLQGNPNIMSMLWLSPQHILIQCDASRRIVENRRIFVGKHVHDAFAGYAHRQLAKMETRDPAELRRYLALTYEAKARGIHPNEKGIVSPYPDDYDQHSGDAVNAKSHGNDALLSQLRHFLKKGENLGYMGDKRKQLVLNHGYDSKNAAHLIRLLRMCIEFMNTGEMTVERKADRQELLDIKAGKWGLEHVKALSERLFSEAEEAKRRSPLPSEPDYDAAKKLLVDIVGAEVFGR